MIIAGNHSAAIACTLSAADARPCAGPEAFAKLRGQQLANGAPSPSTPSAPAPPANQRPIGSPGAQKCPVHVPAGRRRYNHLAMTRDRVHELLDLVPDSDLDVAARVLAALAASSDPLALLVATAVPDDEHPSDDELADVVEALRPGAERLPTPKSSASSTAGESATPLELAGDARVPQARATASRQDPRSARPGP